MRQRIAGFVDETYVKVAGRWVYLYRAIDQFGQVIDALVSQKRDRAATRRIFTRALEHAASPTEVITDKAALYPVGTELIIHIMRPGCIRVSTHRADRDVAGEFGMAMPGVVVTSVVLLGPERSAGDGAIAARLGHHAGCCPATR